MSLYRWFFGKIDCADGDCLLKPEPNTCGAFFIHIKAEGGYCLTVTGQSKEIKHHSILESNEIFYIKDDMFFPTIQDLVSHYSHHAGLLGTNTLIKPCITDYGPLQPYCCHDVEVQGRLEGTMVVELAGHGKECLGAPIEMPLFEPQSPECLHSMQLKLAEDCHLRQSIQHPNIVKFWGIYFKKESKVAYVVMECLHSTLSTYLEENGVPDSSTSYNILSDVALGLWYLHNQPLPIIHGGLSAESVLLSTTLQAKISDIKVASIFSNTPACPSHVLQPRSSLKSCYLPPEVHSGNPTYNTSLDCFSFGVLVIHTLSARWPVPTDLGRDAHLTSSATQFDQRVQYMRDVDVTHQMKEMVHNCLHVHPDVRPNMSTIVKKIHLIMVC